ncbi:hypothetical protein ACMGDM_16065 [Sphingomonas sp. DT-51]|uniref:DUF2946 family protein n=1 Tax=Sphingomonas sp. DT-51 TaxID=3396165 RepID=UPI003F1CA5AE
MTLPRQLLARFPRLALWLVTAALAVRLLVPSGYMLAPGGGLALVACSGTAVVTRVDHQHDSPAHHQSPEQPCAFAVLAVALGAAAVVLRLAIGFMAAAVVTAPRPTPAPRAPPRWRPPLRAPPLRHAR